MAESFGKRLGKRIAFERGKIGISLKQLSRKAFGTEEKYAQIARIEEGHIAKPHARTIGAIASVLGISQADIDACRSDSPNYDTPATDASPAASASRGNRSGELTFDELERLSKRFLAYGPNGKRMPQRFLMYLLGNITGHQLHDISDIDYAVLAYEQLYEDFGSSVVISPLALSEKIEQSNACWAGSARREPERFRSVQATDIISLAWVGRDDVVLKTLFSRAVEKLGRPVVVNVSSSCAAACSVMRWFQMEGMPIELMTSDASGREQVLTLRRVSKKAPDFLIAADAPVFYEEHIRVAQYCRRFPIHTRHQNVLVKNGDQKGRVRELFVYPNSSVRLQLKRQYRDLRSRYQLPATPKEHTIELGDYRTVAQTMKPGDIVFAWRPLLGRLIAERVFTSDPQFEFDFDISFFENIALRDSGYAELCDTFANILVFGWRRGVENILLSWLILMSARHFIENFRLSVAGIDESGI